VVWNPKKKLKKKALKIAYSTSQDLAITHILNSFNVSHSSILYVLLNLNPIEIVLSTVLIKLGIPKFVIVLIIAFLL
jgi:hypothetical protein